MIRKILSALASQLEEFLSRFHNRPEGLATAGLIGNSSEERPNKMVISLLNMERETAGGISSGVRRTEEGYARTQPPLLMNMNVMLAAVFDERQYGAALEILSDTLRFLQSTPNFQVDGTTYTIEIVNLSVQDLNNVWTLLGGQYYPSVVCKIRRLYIDNDTVAAGGTTADRPVVTM